MFFYFFLLTWVLTLAFGSESHSIILVLGFLLGAVVGHQSKPHQTDNNETSSR